VKPGGSTAMKSSHRNVAATRKVPRSCEMGAAAGMAAAEGVPATASGRVATTTAMAASSAPATMLCQCRAAARQDQPQGTHRQQNAFALDIHVPLLNLTAAYG
jgi:hypothetical protein